MLTDRVNMPAADPVLPLIPPSDRRRQKRESHIACMVEWSNYDDRFAAFQTSQPEANLLTLPCLAFFTAYLPVS